MTDNGHIKIHRKMLEWEWYQDTNTFVLFLHCLLIANWKEGRFMGNVIPRGSFVSSYSQLAQETNLSVQNVRTAISHLKSTGELTSKSHAKFTIFTVVNYNKYQDDNRQTNNQLTNNQQATNKQLTTIEEGNKERKKEENNINNKKYIYGEFRHVKLTNAERDRLFKDYGEEETLEAIKFLDEYKERKGYTSKNDNLTLRKWVFDAVKRDKAQGDQSQSSPASTNPKAHNFEEREYDYAALESELVNNGKGGQTNG